LVEFQCGCLTDFRSELLAELCGVVGEYGCFVAGARDGDIAESRVEQVRMNADFSVDENPLGGEPLGAVAGDGVAVVKMAMFGRV